jgi:nucleotide-binding universal stress UspA family protein
VRIPHILVADDPDAEAGWARLLAAALDSARPSSARVHLIHVVPGYGLSVVGQYFPEGTEERVLAEAQKTLHDFANEHVDDDLRDSCVIGNGTIYQEILDGAESIAADLIVMGSHRPNMRDYLLGPNSARVVRHASASVLVVRD